MSTIVGVEAAAGVALAADRANVSGDTVTGSIDRVFEFGEAGAAAVGNPGDVGAFERDLRSQLDRDRIERDREARIDRLARVASQVAQDAGVEALVAARDDGDRARLRAVAASGAALEDRVAAFGTGAPVALGRLEGESFDGDIEALEERVREVLEAVAERDSETGEEVDVWSLPSTE
jgi:proteasome beta subunit